MSDIQAPHHEAHQPSVPSVWKGRAVGLLDLDAFFASVEQLDHPEWRGKPVIVGGHPERRGVVSTASYEARTFGVHSGMPSARAQALCPHAIWTQGNFERYRHVSDMVMNIIADQTPFVEQVSVDEAFFDITPGRFNQHDPVLICQDIQQSVQELGISCSIGLSINKTVSKIASEIQKPRGLTVVYPGTEQDFLAPLSVHAMSGIGPATQRTLELLGIRTLGDLARADTFVLAQHLGVIGPRLMERAQGHDPSPVAERARATEPKSISHERTFTQDLTQQEDVVSALHYLAEMVARRLRKEGLRGRTVTLKITYRYGESRTARRTRTTPCNSADEMIQTALDMLPDLWQPGVHVRLMGLEISNWHKAPVQLSLFDDTEADDEQRATEDNLAKTADYLRERFGESAVMYGSELRFKDAVSDTKPRGSQGF